MIIAWLSWPDYEARAFELSPTTRLCPRPVARKVTMACPAVHPHTSKGMCVSEDALQNEICRFLPTLPWAVAFVSNTNH